MILAVIPLLLCIVGIIELDSKVSETTFFHFDS